MSNTPCVYTHKNASTGEIFYIGYSNSPKSRPYQKKGSARNERWHKYVADNLCGDQSKIDIDVTTFDTKGEALKYECDLIEKLKPETNITHNPAYMHMDEEQNIIKIVGDDLEICVYSLKQEVDLTALRSDLSKYREDKKLSDINFTTFMRSVGTLEFIEELKNNGYENPVRHNGKMSKASRTYCCVPLAIYFLQRSSARFNRQIIEEFSNMRGSEKRVVHADLFKGLNIAIDTKLKGRDGKNNRGLFIQCANRIKAIVKPNEDNWNKATAEQLRRRVDIEERAITVLSTGLVEGKEGLYEVIDSVANL